MKNPSAMRARRPRGSFCGLKLSRYFARARRSLASSYSPTYRSAAYLHALLAAYRKVSAPHGLQFGEPSVARSEIFAAEVRALRYAPLRYAPLRYAPLRSAPLRSARPGGPRR